MVAIMERQVSWARILCACTDTQKYLMAGELDAPKEVLKQLSASNSDRIRRRVAENVATPIAVLVEMALDKEPEIRIAVAENNSTPASVKLFLSADDCPDVRYAIAENANTEEQVLQKLAYNDDNPYVSARARKTLASLTTTSAAEDIVDKFKTIISEQFAV